MFDSAQIILFVFILVLLVLFVVLGIQAFFILKELRITIAKANKVLDNTGQITESVSGPITNLSSVLMGLKTGAAFAKLLKTVEDKDE